jgi:hypothetical protein
MARDRSRTCSPAQEADRPSALGALLRGPEKPPVSFSGLRYSIDELSGGLHVGEPFRTRSPSRTMIDVFPNLGEDKIFNP